MSARIDIILGVLKAVQTKAGQRATLVEIKRLRIAASQKIATERKCTLPSVMDAYGQELEPYSRGNKAFDQLVEAWLNRDDGKLKEVLLKRADEEDNRKIDSFF